MTIRRLTRFLAVLCMASLLVSTSVAQPGPGFRGGRGRGSDEQFAVDRDAFHELLARHDQIDRTVKTLNNGVETITTSTDAQIVKHLQEHVAAMKARIENDHPIRLRDPLFAELFRHAAEIELQYELLQNGVRVTETSTNPAVVRLIHAHAAVVSKFVENGFPEARKNHAVPTAAAPDAAQRPKLDEQQTQRLLQLSAAFDRLFIPALALTSQQDQRPALTALARLQQEAPAIMRDATTILGVAAGQAQRWPVIESALDDAAALAEKGRLLEAHETLEPIRGMLAADRRRLGVNYPLDALNEFHEVMEAIVKPSAQAKPEDLSNQRIDQLKELATEASALWARVEQTSFSGDEFQFGEQTLQILDQTIAVERQALIALNRSLRDADKGAILRAARAIKPPFAKAYMLFGDFPK